MIIFLNLCMKVRICLILRIKFLSEFNIKEKVVKLLRSCELYLGIF